MTTEATIFLMLMVALALGVGWLMGRGQSNNQQGESYYSGYSDGYNAALDDIEEQVKAREAKEKKAKKATPKKKGKK